MQIAGSHGIDTEEDLQKHLINSIQVRLGATTCSDDVANALKLVLADTPPHLLVYLLDYFCSSFSPPAGLKEHHMPYQSKQISFLGRRTSYRSQSKCCD